MRLIRYLVSLGLVLAVCAAMSPAVADAAIAMPTEGPAGAAQAAPDLTARSAIAVDLTNGLQLFNHNADMRVPPASTMKVVTALVARSILPPDEQVTIVEQDLSLPEDYSKMGLELGDVATVEALLYGTLLSSGGDSALALARVAGQRLDPSTDDPVGRFVEEMNAFASSHRMFDSHFSNPVGIDSEDHYSTARDLVRATEQLLGDWLLSNIVATPEVLVTVGGPNAREIYLFSTNELVLSGESIGGKTGTTDLAGQCLVNVTMRGNHQVVTVILGSEDRYLDTQALLEDVGQRFRFVHIGAGSNVLGTVDELAAMGLMFPVGKTLLVTPAQAETLQYELQLTGERSPNGKAGTARFLVGGREVLVLPVHTLD